MVADIHLNECETELLQFVEKLKCSIYPKKLGCSIFPIEKETEDDKMIAQYLGRTREPVKVGEISLECPLRIFLLWSCMPLCRGHQEITKQSYAMVHRVRICCEHLHGGFVPAHCFLPVPGCKITRKAQITLDAVWLSYSDVAAEAARDGFTAMVRRHGFLVLAVASLGEYITELTGSPEDTTLFERKKLGVIGRGQKITDESEHFFWKDDIKVPCGWLISSE